MCEWQKEMTSRIGQQVQALRGDRTALWLSEETERLGMKVSRSALSELENGKRKSISLAEFLILAAALNVPPSQLLFNEYPDGLFEFIPGYDTTAFQATNWISGDQRLLVTEDPVSLTATPDTLVRLARERSDTNNLYGDLLRAGKDPIEIIEYVDKQVAQLNHQIVEAGGTVVQAGENGEG